MKLREDPTRGGNQLKFHFRGRERPVIFDADDECFGRFRRNLNERDSDPGFGEFNTPLGHDIWINLRRAQIVNFLVELDRVLPFGPKRLKPSRLYPGGDKESDFEVQLDVIFLLAGIEKPYHVGSISGHEWVTISTSFQMLERPFFSILDGDGELAAFRIDDIEMAIGVEVDRYEPEDLERLKEIIIF